MRVDSTMSSVSKKRESMTVYEDSDMRGREGLIEDKKTYEL